MLSVAGKGTSSMSLDSEMAILIPESNISSSFLTGEDEEKFFMKLGIRNNFYF
jgi:hypothetical protein